MIFFVWIMASAAIRKESNEIPSLKICPLYQIHPFNSKKPTLPVKIPLDYHLLNIRTVIKNHSGVPGFDKLLKELKNPGVYTQKGIAHTLNAIKDFKPGDISI